MATRTLTWPTAKETNDALDALFSPGLDLIDVIAGPPSRGYFGLIETKMCREDGHWLREGVPVPSFEDIGILAVFTARLREQVKDLEELVDELDKLMEVVWLNGLEEASDAS